MCIGLYAKAAKVLMSNDVVAEYDEDMKKLIEESGVKIIKQIEAAIEKDKTMSNLNGKVKEIKKLI